MDRSYDDVDPFTGLTDRSKTAFPRRCPSCGRYFESAEAFFKETHCVRNGASGLKSTRDDQDRPMVELFRNCPCGSTLVQCFNDRRDLSEPGLRRRRLFDQLLRLLENKGMASQQARVELLKLFRGQSSETLSRMGISLPEGS